MRKVCLVLNSKNPEAKKAFKFVRGFLLKQGYIVFSRLRKPILRQRLEWVMAFGGDGTMLHTANKLARTNVPLVGVNFGHKGYSCQIQPDQLQERLKSLVDKQFIIECRTRIMAKIINKKKIKKNIDALNEIVVGGINRAVWLDLKISHDGQNKSAVIVGDGLILSTRTGSTAYNFSAGGPVLFSDVFSVVASNVFSFESKYFKPNTKSFVVPVDASFVVKSMRIGKFSPYVIADGQRDYRLKKRDRVIIAKSSLISRAIRF